MDGCFELLLETKFDMKCVKITFWKLSRIYLNMTFY